MSILPRFVADVMLGSLSRWLRLFGFDTLYRNDFSDRELIKISLQEDRIVLTRDNALARSRLLKKVLLIQSETIKEQIKEVLSTIPISFDLLSLRPRCPVCNGETESIIKEKIKEEIPDYVAISNQEFIICKSCGKIYWHGTHKDRIDKIKKEILKNLK
ncbi:Mut7-C RNAse domain-containing protein [Thermodesulfovibrio yellowstonii]|uniref:Mut7-C RNAse domain-containing protein n=1 Tax=Thermodesulfovibrio yellowstonii TaxID=28262 RepID=UPI0024B344C2|nr:Mut7-C RNAse domain-containing protein [Thermodesulfovibrio yellowstonii]MDI6865912.1 Mut7-C RNAse domain-containing protein [Thermodesulfovibrio yellowstonii]